MAKNNPHLNGDQLHKEDSIKTRRAIFLIAILCCPIVVVLCVAIGLSVQSNGESHVTNALLTEFSYNEDNRTLHYNLELHVSIRNLNDRVGIYCEYVQAKALYEHVWFAYSNSNISPFYIPGQTSHCLTAQFKGRRLISLDANQTSEYHKHKNSGIYDIDVELNLIQFSPDLLNTKIYCNLEVPLTSSSSSSGTFQTTRCSWNFGGSSY